MFLSNLNGMYLLSPWLFVILIIIVDQTTLGRVANRGASQYKDATLPI